MKSRKHSGYTQRLSQALSFSAAVVTLSLISQSLPSPGIAAPEAAKAESQSKSSTEKEAVLKGALNCTEIKTLSKDLHNMEIVFKHSKCKIEGDWAWVELDPASKDGKQNFETLTGVMHKKGGQWTVVQWLGVEELSAIPTPSLFNPWKKDFIKKHPGCPEHIFPKS